MNVLQLLVWKDHVAFLFSEKVEGRVDVWYDTLYVQECKGSLEEDIKN